MKNNILLSIVMPTFWHLDMTKQTLTNLKSIVPWGTEIIVVDDGSTDWTVEYLKQQKDIIFIDNKINKWVTYSWNTWVAKARWKYICVINNDILFPKNFFEKLMDWFTSTSIAMTVPRWTHWRKWKESPVIRYYINHLCWFCYMFKQDLKDKLFPIDKRLRTFGNDNRLYYMCKEMKMDVCTVHDAICHHYESVTTLSIENIDLHMLFNIANEEWWNIKPIATATDNIKQNVLV